MAFFTGRVGALRLDNVEVAKVRDWSIEATVNLLDTTTLGDGASTYHPGIKGATGSATLVYYRLEPGESATKKQFTELLSKIMKQGRIQITDRVELRLSTNSGVAADTLRFQAYITSANITVTNGELVTVPIQFTVDGDFEATIQ
jgi:hypothetical protein